MAIQGQPPVELPTFETAGSTPSNDCEIIYTPSSTSSMSAMVSSSTVSPASSASVSIRQYIYLMPYPFPKIAPVPYSIHLPSKNPLNLPTRPYEPTSTLVLTSPLKTFVDLRFFKPTSAHETPLPNAPHSDDRKRLEWGFAGSSASKPIDDPNAQPGEEKWPGVTYSKWTQFVDSRFPVGYKDIPVDEGLMYPISEFKTLEHGHMFHPSVDAVKTHEEMWFDPPVQATSHSGDGKKICVVLRAQDDVAGVRGVIVRLGQFCQGILKIGDGTTVERWEWGCEGKEEGEKTWRRTARVGGLLIPCSAAFREEVLGMGAKVRYGSYEWVVEEVWAWE
ncbi:hypothetical protein CC86DRAFT_149914 [Ophiobolus disseminans]|uniref:Protein HRI1 n=1 Tax=Ophiobolus disseminans TaxID=1469910 RepID=A0A6A6ZFP7_9PLEO|nr:hypothetical protein CC86DRAFT_149914 [Ophiobolus disseminans]